MRFSVICLLWDFIEDKTRKEGFVLLFLFLFQLLKIGLVAAPKSGDIIV